MELAYFDFKYFMENMEIKELRVIKNYIVFLLLPKNETLFEGKKVEKAYALFAVDGNKRELKDLKEFYVKLDKELLLIYEAGFII